MPASLVRITLESLDEDQLERVIILCTEDEASWRVDLVYNARQYGSDEPYRPCGGEVRLRFDRPSVKGQVRQGRKSTTIRTPAYDAAKAADLHSECKIAKDEVPPPTK